MKEERKNRASPPIWCVCVPYRANTRDKKSRPSVFHVAENQQKWNLFFQLKGRMKKRSKPIKQAQQSKYRKSQKRRKNKFCFEEIPVNGGDAQRALYGMLEGWCFIFLLFDFRRVTTTIFIQKKKKKIRRAKSRCLPYGDRRSSLGCIYKTVKTIACSAISIYCKLHLTVTIRSASRCNPERRPKEGKKRISHTNVIQIQRLDTERFFSSVRGHKGNQFLASRNLLVIVVSPSAYARFWHYKSISMNGQEISLSPSIDLHQSKRFEWKTFGKKKKKSPSLPRI